MAAFAQSSTTLESLTPREREVAELVADGASHKSVARELGLAVRTVSFHVWNAAQKLPGDGRPSVKIARFSHLFQSSDSAA
mgnify:CR=1 FL=1